MLPPLVQKPMIMLFLDIRYIALFLHYINYYNVFHSLGHPRIYTPLQCADLSYVIDYFTLMLQIDDGHINMTGLYICVFEIIIKYHLNEIQV